MLIGIALITFLPFIIDRFLYRKIDGFPSTLSLPLAAVTIEYLISIFNPYATWASFAYTQFEHTALIQVVSITGIWGITFLLFWFYSFVNWIWDNQFQKVKKGVILFITTFLIVFMFGEAKLFYSSLIQENTVKIAGITVPNIHLFKDDDLDQLQIEPNVEMENTINEKLVELHNELIDLTERVANAGSKIIFWSEGNGIVLKNNEELLINRVKEIAKENETYILMALATITPGQQAIENKVIMINNNGEKAFTYHKSKPVPGELIAESDSEIKFIDTEYGRIGSVICYDMDFPTYIRQAGQLNIDILLVPSLDWEEINPIHSHMAAFRGIENGFNTFRQTNLGLSLATDYNGRPLAKMDHYLTEDRVLIAHLPTKRLHVPYSYTGDLFSWLCIIGLFLFIIKRKN